MYVIELVGKCQRLKLSTLNFGNRSEGATGGVFVPIEVRGAGGVYVAIAQLSFPHIAGANVLSPPLHKQTFKKSLFVESAVKWPRNHRLRSPVCSRSYIAKESMAASGRIRSLTGLTVLSSR